MLLQENLNVWLYQFTPHIAGFNFFIIDNLHISIPSYIITMLLQENLNVWLYQSNNANEGP